MHISNCQILFLIIQYESPDKTTVIFADLTVIILVSSSVKNIWVIPGSSTVHMTTLGILNLSNSRVLNWRHDYSPGILLLSSSRVFNHAHYYPRYFTFELFQGPRLLNRSHVYLGVGIIHLGYSWALTASAVHIKNPFFTVFIPITFYL